MRRSKKSRNGQDETPDPTPTAATLGPEPKPPAAPQRLEDPGELARRVNLLVETLHPGQDTDTVATQLSDDLAKAGHVLSSDGWEAILNGTPGSCDDAELLTGLCYAFDVSDTYLTHWEAERDERLEAELELLAAMRDSGVTNFHACGRGPTPPVIGPETLRELAAILRKHAGDDEPGDLS